VKCFRIFLLACPINGLQMATGVFFQSIGRPTQATILSLSRQVVYLLPMALGVEGALWAGPLADVLAFITALIMLKLYWKKFRRI
jgi:Na+-driven multidrug efflux pump